MLACIGWGLGMSASFLENFGVGQVSEKIAAVTDTVDANVSKYVNITFSTISPLILTSLIILAASFFAYAYVKKNSEGSFRNFVVFGAILIAFAAPSTLYGIKHGRIWMSTFFAALYVLGSPFFIRKIFQYSKSLSTKERLTISIMKVILFGFACVVLIGTFVTLIFPIAPTMTQAKLFISLTTLASQVYLWFFLNTIIAVLWIWQMKVHKTGLLRFISRAPYATLNALFAITSAIALFAEWLPLMPMQFIIANTGVFLFIIAFILSSILYHTFNKLTEHVCKKFFSQSMIDLFPIEKAFRIFLMAVSVIIVDNLFDAYKLWLNGKPLFISYIEQAVLRIICAFSVLLGMNKVSTFIRQYLRYHERRVKRVDRNRRLLSASTFVQGIVPFLLKTTAVIIALVIFGIPFQYIATTIALAILFLSFIGKKVLEDITQGLLHTLFGGHLAVGDLIETGSSVGFIESMTLYNITIRSPSTGALHVISFSDVRNFTHHDREKARALAHVFIPSHVSWREFVSYADEAMLVMQQHEVHGQYFLGRVSYDIEEYDSQYVKARIGFDTITGGGYQFALRRVFLTALRDVMDRHGIQLSPEQTVHCYGLPASQLKERSEKQKNREQQEKAVQIGFKHPQDTNKKQKFEHKKEPLDNNKHPENP